MTMESLPRLPRLRSTPRNQLPSNRIPLLDTPFRNSNPFPEIEPAPLSPPTSYTSSSCNSGSSRTSSSPIEPEHFLSFTTPDVGIFRASKSRYKNRRPTENGNNSRRSHRNGAAASPPPPPPRDVDFTQNIAPPRCGSSIPHPEKFPPDIRMLLQRLTCFSTRQNRAILVFIVTYYENEEEALKNTRDNSADHEERWDINMKLDFVGRLKRRFADLLKGDYSPKRVQRKLEAVYEEPMPDIHW